MSPRPTVSVIVVLYNGRRYIERCLRSILECGAEDLELIVVDNASSDGGAEVVAREFPGVRLVRGTMNLGYAGGINLGLEHASGRYIAPLNMDTEVAPGWLEPMIAWLEAHPEVGAVTPVILIDQDRERVNAMGAAIHLTGLSFCRGLRLPRASIPTAPFSVPGVSGAAYVIRRERLKRMGGAPAECFMGNDDVVLSWRLRMMGDEIYCVPTSVVYHRYNLTFDPEKLWLVERNRHAMLLTALQKRTMLAMLPLHALTETAILAYCIIKGPAYLEAKLRAVRWVWERREELRTRRARIQALREAPDREVLRGLDAQLQWRQLLGILGPTGPRDETVPE